MTKLVFAALMAAFATISVAHAAGKSDPLAGFDFYTSQSAYQSPPLTLLVPTNQTVLDLGHNIDLSATDEDGPMIKGDGTAVVCLSEDGEDQSCQSFKTWSEAEAYARVNIDAGPWANLGHMSGSVEEFVIDDPLWYIETMALVERAGRFDTGPSMPDTVVEPMPAAIASN